MIVHAHTPKNRKCSGRTPARDFSRVFTVHKAMLTTIRKVISSLPGLSFLEQRLPHAIYEFSNSRETVRTVDTQELIIISRYDQFLTLMSSVWLVLCIRANKSVISDSTHVGPIVNASPTTPNRQYR